MAVTGAHGELVGETIPLDRMRAFAVYGVIGILLLLLLVECLSKLFGIKQYSVPIELYGLAGTIVAGLFASIAMQRLGGGGNTSPPAPPKPPGMMPPMQPPSVLPPSQGPLMGPPKTGG